MWRKADRYVQIWRCRCKLYIWKRFPAITDKYSYFNGSYMHMYICKMEAS